ncbi:hypothetical protein KC364_g27 [Hortaea werneckii]|nr:hypothetical protein KC364_g27 [Hortaea werneckii]
MASSAAGWRPEEEEGSVGSGESELGVASAEGSTQVTRVEEGGCDVVDADAESLDLREEGEEVVECVAEGSDGGAEEVCQGEALGEGTVFDGQGFEGLGKGHDAVEEVGVDAAAETQVLQPWRPGKGSARVVVGAEAGGAGKTEGTEAGLSLTRLRSKVPGLGCDELFQLILRAAEQAGGQTPTTLVHETAHVEALNQFAERALAHMQVDGGAHGAHELVEVAAVQGLLGLFGYGDVGEDFEDDLVGEVDRAVCPGGIDLIAVFVPTLGL